MAEAADERDVKFAAMLKGLFGAGGDIGRASLDLGPGKIVKIQPGFPLEPQKIEGERIKLSEYGMEIEIRDDPFDAIEKLDGLGRADSKPERGRADEAEERDPDYYSDPRDGDPFDLPSAEDDGYDGVDPEDEEEERSDGHPHGRTPPREPEQGYRDRQDDTARRHRQVLLAVPLGPTLRNGKPRYEYQKHRLELRNGAARYPDGSPWEIAEARLDEWLIHCGAQASRCGCAYQAHADHPGRQCENTAVVMTVWGNAHIPFCGPCAHAEVQLGMNKMDGGSYTKGVLVLDWVPDDV